MYAVIKSANYPSNYDDNLACKWWFSSPKDTHIVVSVHEFSTETNYDWVQIGSGHIPETNTLVVLTGSTYGSLTIEDNKAWMIFDSDGSFNARGFNITFYYSK